MNYVTADLRLICAWCNTLMRAPQNEDSMEEVPESHGICRCCAVKLGLPEDRIVH